MYEEPASQSSTEITEQEQAYQRELDAISELALSKDVAEIAKRLDLPEESVALSLNCVGDRYRKGKIMVSGQMKKATHFAHMVRVAYAVQHFFPENEVGKRMAILHDTKEEADEGNEEMYKQSDLANEIDILTEEEVTEEEIHQASQNLPEGFDAEYFATYKKYIARLNENWDKIGAMELCDRLDGTSSFVYLKNEKYKNRMPYKALESFGRIWATINGKTGEVVDRIKDNCRKWFAEFEITEEQVEQAEKRFLN